MLQLLKGAEVAEALSRKIGEKVELLSGIGVTPLLAIIRVGEKGDDIAYEKSAVKRCESAGLGVRQIHLPADVSQEDFLAQINAVNADAAIHGCLVLRPLPPHLDDALLRQTLAPAKDVDGITDGSLAGVFTGSGVGYPPCTAAACVELLKHYEIPLAGKKVVVVGRSLVVGKPLAMLLLAENATVTVCHSRTANLRSCCRDGEILIAAAGHPGLITGRCMFPGQIVLDVGINFTADGKMVGDVDAAAAEEVANALSPVPGGVGPVTTWMLVKHTVDAAMKASADVLPAPVEAASKEAAPAAEKAAAAPEKAMDADKEKIAAEKKSRPRRRRKKFGKAEA